MHASSADAGARAGASHEAFWDIHGSSLYALARGLLGDETAAQRAVTFAMVDAYSSAGEGAELSTEVTLRTAAACVYHRCGAGFAEAPRERTITAPPITVRLRDLAENQRAALALCVFGGHTYQQAAKRVGLSSDVVADLLTSGLQELRLET